MATITIQIGNGDDKLTQKEWAKFVRDMEKTIKKSAEAVHFTGFSHGGAEWQNSAWVFECPEEKLPELKQEAARLGKKFGQDSVAWTPGVTEFI